MKMEIWMKSFYGVLDNILLYVFQVDLYIINEVFSLIILLIFERFMLVFTIFIKILGTIFIVFYVAMNLISEILTVQFMHLIHALVAIFCLDKYLWYNIYTILTCSFLFYVIYFHLCITKTPYIITFKRSIKYIILVVNLCYWFPDLLMIFVDKSYPPINAVAYLHTKLVIIPLRPLYEYYFPTYIDQMSFKYGLYHSVLYEHDLANWGNAYVRLHRNIMQYFLDFYILIFYFFFKQFLWNPIRYLFHIFKKSRLYNYLLCEINIIKEEEPVWYSIFFHTKRIIMNEKERFSDYCDKGFFGIDYGYTEPFIRTPIRNLIYFINNKYIDFQIKYYGTEKEKTKPLISYRPRNFCERTYDDFEDEQF